MNIAIIPARGGSKRIERKNIRSFCGKPMIAWSIEAALASELFSKVIVSTDCPAIADVSRSYGATTPFVRPAELSDDFTPTIPVVRQAIQWLLENSRTSVQQVCCLYATAPFVQASDLRRGLDILTANEQLEFTFPVTEFASSIYRSLKIDSDRVSMNWPEHELTRTQDLPAAYHDVGQFYWGRTNAWEDHTGFYSARSAPIVLPAWRVQDIDTPEDWTKAELMFPVLREKMAREHQQYREQCDSRESLKKTGA